MIFFYFSLVLSILFTLLVSSLRVISRFPKLWGYLKFFKRFNVIPKLVVISHIFGYRFFGRFSRIHPIKFSCIKYACVSLLIISIIFRTFVIKDGLFVNHPYIIMITSLIFALNTIFRSFVSFGIIINQTKLFTFLYLQKFFSEIQKVPYWDNYVKELFERTKVSEKMEKDQNKKT